MKRFCGTLCAVALFMSATAPAQAALVGTNEVLSQAQASADRTHLLQMLERDAVRDRLSAMGVDPADARERVQRMTDQEVAQLQGRLEEVPAGGDGLGLVVFIFVVFIVTDAIGATDIFPFVQPVN